jgi:CD109 antigen
MRLLVAFVTLLAFVWRVEGIGPTYTVVAPSVVRPNSDYLVAVSAFGIGDQEQQDVELRIQGRSASSGQTIEIRQDTRVRSDQTEIVRLRIGDLGKGSYSLTARGTFPISFDQTQRLSYVHKGYSVFIQTDKAIYRPGNSVRFRAVVVTPQLKPSVVGSIDVTMTDGGGNIIRRWDRVFTTKGVFAADLLLSEVPVMGDWNITVDVSGQLFSRSFQVVEYVLPKFRVDISLPDYGILSEGTTRAVIRATYAHGGPVVGEATISVFPTFKSSTLQPFNFEPVRITFNLSLKF